MKIKDELASLQPRREEMKAAKEAAEAPEREAKAAFDQEWEGKVFTHL